MWRNGWECMDHLLFHCPETASLWPSLSAEAILSRDDSSSGMHCCVKGLRSLEGRREVKYWEMSWGGHFFSGFGWREKRWITYAKAFGYGHLRAPVYLEFRGSISATLSLESYCVC